MAGVNLSDNRVQILLRGIRDHPDCTTGDIWHLDWQKRITGYHGKGSFNYGFIERRMPRLIKGGYVVRGAKYRLSLTDAGLDAISKRG